MTGLQLSQFPLELLEIILSYLPKSELDKLVEFDYLKIPVLKSIYSSVIITAKVPFHHNYMPSYSAHKRSGPKVRVPVFDESKPDFSCIKSLTDFLEDNNLPFPKNVRFLHPIDIILAYDTHPGVLQNCIIETNLEMFGDSDNPDLRKTYLQKLISLPLKFGRVTNCQILHELVPESSVQFTKKLTSASFSKEFSLEIAFQYDRYQNLVHLEIEDRISYEVVKYIPRSVKKLRCRILCPEFELREFDFPRGLRRLNVAFHHYPLNCVVNLNNLEYLADLEFSFNRHGRRIIYRNIRLPKSLKLVKGLHGVVLDIMEIQNQCPKLTSFDCLKVKHPEKNDATLKFSENLTQLRIKGALLEHIERCENDPSVIHVTDTKRRKIECTVASTAMKLPKNLQSLYIDGESQYRQPKVEVGDLPTLFSNKNENILQDLKTLTLRHFDGFSRFGHIPRSLTELRIHSPTSEMEQLNSDFFDDLKSVLSLKFLLIESSLDPYFEYELPPKLETFILIRSNFRKFSIRSESLKYLHLEETEFSELNSETFQIPESLVELSILECDIILFAKSFDFPQNLQKLSIRTEILQRIPKLPLNIKTLYISGRILEKTQDEFSALPVSLEELKIFITRGSPRLFIPDLSHLVNLKTLGFSLGYFENTETKSNGPINLNLFPKSLTKLFIRRCNVTSFAGTFSDFPKLEHLDISGNKLEVWLSSSPEELSFGDSIKTIVLLYHDFSLVKVRRLIDYLKTYPYFRQLVVDAMDIPEDLSDLAMQRYLVQRNHMY
ncbi:hypothetical protein G210_4219 [Candida maltosa Xu316]|uniref:F-box domain-containing protein n=1 Tax=Candida maltosa (strain Xu316) TaxID=1245528 RepID=M3IH42_CANMX|nr:hypothetical protein G210_4219 [Candida maltosa Xu316]